MKQRGINVCNFLMCAYVVAQYSTVVQARHSFRPAGAAAVSVRPLAPTGRPAPPTESDGTVAVVLCLTAKNTKPQRLEERSVAQLLVRSFRRTAETARYNYSLYVGVDDNDPVWALAPSVAFLVRIGVDAGARRVVVRHFQNLENHIPMNEILKVAYDDGCRYFVRVNDDTEFVTSGWTSAGVAALAAFDPPNVGVVGPTFRKGNVNILTHDMTHRTHLDIFGGVYYADAFDNWWLDDWISAVYGPERTRKLPSWTVRHHVGFHGTRYKVAHHKGGLLEKEVRAGKEKIAAWLRQRAASGAVDDGPPGDCGAQRACGQLVSYSLYGTDSRYTLGALENAKLVATVYPGWTMRVYYDSTVPLAVVGTFRASPHVDLVDMTGASLANPMTWRFLAASDRSALRACFRDVDSRLSAREKAAVDAWVASGKRFHVMRDHPSHSHYAMSGGMWCVARGGFPQMETALKAAPVGTGYVEDMHFLTRRVWPTARTSVLQHDTFGCALPTWGPSVPFPTARVGWEHVGSVYINGAMRETDVIILKYTVPPKCAPASVVSNFPTSILHVVATSSRNGTVRNAIPDSNYFNAATADEGALGHAAPG